LIGALKRKVGSIFLSRFGIVKPGQASPLFRAMPREIAAARIRVEERRQIVHINQDDPPELAVTEASVAPVADGADMAPLRSGDIVD
jgi:hypothetical protein